jgi:serine/threonine kinase PknH
MPSAEHPSAVLTTGPNPTAMAHFTQGGPPPLPYPPQYAASGPFPVPQPNGAASANPMLKWIIAGAGVVAAAVVLVVVLVAAGVFSKGSSPAATPAATPTSTSASSIASSPPSSSADASTGPTPMSDSDYRLLRLLPPGYASGICVPANERVNGALSTLNCDANSEPGGPTTSQYSLFSDPAALDREFQIFLNEDSLFNCPGATEAPSKWNYNQTPDRTAGSVGCGTYKNGPDLIWTKDAQLLLGSGQGPDISAMHQWWSKYA